jgi:hypothetical protein
VILLKKMMMTLDSLMINSVFFKQFSQIYFFLSIKLNNYLEQQKKVKCFQLCLLMYTIQLQIVYQIFLLFVNFFFEVNTNSINLDVEKETVQRVNSFFLFFFLTKFLFDNSKYKCQFCWLLHIFKEKKYYS